MNINRGVHDRRSQLLSHDANEESFVFEQKLRNRLTTTESQNGKQNLFNNVQEVPRLRRSVVARAVQNMCCSTPMPTNRNTNYFCEDNISPINPVSNSEASTEEQENKKEGDEENKKINLKEIQVVLNKISPPIVISDSEDEELVQNIEEVAGNKISQITGTESCCNVVEGNKYSKRTEDSEHQENIHDGSRRNVALRKKSNNRTPSTKDNISDVINQQSNRTLSKQINSLIIELDKSLLQNKTDRTSDAVQLPTLYEEENIVSKSDFNNIENSNNKNTSKMTLRSKNSNSLKKDSKLSNTVTQHLNKTPNLLINEPSDENLSHSKTLNSKQKTSDAIHQTPIPYQPENIIYKSDVNNVESADTQNTSNMILRSQNCNSTKKRQGRTKLTSPKLSRLRNIENSKENISDVFKSRKETPVKMVDNNCANDHTNIIKSDTKNRDATSSKVKLQKRISARKISFTSKTKNNNESNGNTPVIDKDKNLPVSTLEPVAMSSKIPILRSRSKSKEKMDEANVKHVQIDVINSLEARECNEHITNEKSPNLHKKSPPKRPPRKKRLRNLNLTKTKNNLTVDPVTKDSPANIKCADGPYIRNDVNKLRDRSNSKIVIGSEGRNDEQEKNKSINQNEENNCASVLENNLEKTLTNERETSPMIFNTINKIDYNNRDTLPTLDKSKAENLDQLVFKIKMVNKEVQTSAKGTDSVGKNGNASKRSKKLSKKALSFEVNNSTKSSSDSEIIKELEKSKDHPYLLYQSLGDEWGVNLSSDDDEVFDDTLCYDQENGPWRLDDDLQIFPRLSVVTLNFIKSAQEIESQRISQDYNEFNESNSLLGNGENFSIAPSHSTNLGCIKKNELQKYSRKTVFNNGKTVKSKSSDTDKLKTPSEESCVPNKESSNKKKRNSKEVKALVSVETQITNKDNSGPDLPLRKSFTAVNESYEKANGENNNTDVRNTEKDELIQNHKSDNEEHHVSLESVSLSSPLKDSTSAVKETSRKPNRKTRVSRSTNKKVNNASKKKQFPKNGMQIADNLTKNVIQDDDQVEDVLAVPLENSTPHLRDSVSINKNGESSGSENINKSGRVNDETIKEQISSSKNGITCAIDNEIFDGELKDNESPEVQNTSVITTKTARENVLNEDTVGNPSSHLKVPIALNQNNHSVLGKRPSPKKSVKKRKSKRMKVTSETDDVSSTTHSQQETGLRRSSRDKKVPPRRYYGVVTTYSERDFNVFDASSKRTISDRLTKPRTKNKRTASNDTKIEKPSVKRGKSEKKGKHRENIPQVANRGRKKKTQSNNEESNNDRLADNINSNNVEASTNILSEGSCENDLIGFTLRMNSNSQDSAYQTATSRNETNENRMEPLTFINSPILENTNINSEIDDNNDINVSGTHNNVEENWNSQPNEDFVFPSTLPGSSSRSSDKDSRRTTVTFESSSTRIGRTLGGRITKTNKKKDIGSKISKILSRSHNTSKEQELFNQKEVNSSAASSDVQDAVSRRTSILQMKPTPDEYITLFSDVNLVSMRYVDKIPKFKLVRDNLLLADCLTNVKDGGTMGYLKLPPAGQKSLHIARKFSLFYFVLEGECFVQVHNKTSTIKKFGAFIVPIGVEYSIVNKSKMDELALGFVKVPAKEET